MKRSIGTPGMVATLGGLLALPLGLLILLLPLLATELSRPRDSAWGAVVLLLALVLVTSADRLSGAPMLGVICGGLLIGRLGMEVGLGRWRQLSAEEQQRLGSLERWTTSFSQLGATLAGAAGQLGAGLGGLTRGLRQGSAAAATDEGKAASGRAGGRGRGKLWVRPEAPPAPAEAAAPQAGISEPGSLHEDGPEPPAPAGEAASSASPGSVAGEP